MNIKIIKVLRNLFIISLPLLLTACASTDLSKTDISLNLLSSVFGHVDQYVSAGDTVFQTLMRYFNLGLAGVVTIVFGYSIFQYTIKGSVGNAMQTSQSAGMNLVRLSIGLALMLPLANGYSMIQNLVFVVVEHSISMADGLYAIVDDSTKDGKLPVFNTSDLTKSNLASQSSATTSISKKDITQAGQYAGAIFLSRVIDWQSYLSAVPGNPKKPPQLPAANIIPNTTPAQQDNTSPSDILYLQTSNMFLGNMSRQWACFSFLKAQASTGDPNQYTIYINTKNPSNNQLEYPNLHAECSDVASSMDQNYNTARDVIQQSVQQLILTQAEVFAEDLPSFATSKKPDSTTTDIGWLNMGVAVLKMTGSATPKAQLPAAKDVGTSLGNVHISLQCTPTDNLPCKIGLDGQHLVSSISLAAGDTSSNSIIGMDYSAFNPPSSKAATVDSNADFTSPAARIGGLTAALAPLDVYSIVTADAVGRMAMSMANQDLFNKTQADGSTVNPFVELHNIGMACLSGANSLWEKVMGMVFGITILASICSCESPGAAINSASLTIIKPLISMIMLVFLMAGIILGYWLPIFPAILFTFMAIGWFLCVIEALVSAPLICLGLTHPEDQDFLGRAEQGIMLLVSVFLRPALMVIGMTFALAITYAGIYVLNRMFAIVLTNGASNNLSQGLVQFGSASISLRMIIIFPGIMLVYSIMVYNVITFCFGAAPDLVKFVNKWIGIPEVSDYQALDMAKATSGPMSKIAGQGSGLISGDVSASKTGAQGPSLGEMNKNRKANKTKIKPKK